MSENSNLNEFIDTVLKNLHKNGFPEKQVSFPLEKMYEAADQKDLSFNTVLSELEKQDIVHSKTPDKIIFSKKQDAPAVGAAGPGGFDFSQLGDLGGLGDLGDLAGSINPDMFKGMDMSKVMSMAKDMMKNMSPEQMAAVKDQYANMSEDEKKAMLDKAKDSGMFS